MQAVPYTGRSMKSVTNEMRSPMLAGPAAPASLLSQDAGSYTLSLHLHIAAKATSSLPAAWVSAFTSTDEAVAVAEVRTEYSRLSPEFPAPLRNAITVSICRVSAPSKPPRGASRLWDSLP